MSRLKSLTLAAAVCLALVFSAAPADALEIEEVHWGFDGQAVQHQFNMLSVLVSNPSPEAFDGGMQLSKSALGSGNVDAPLRQPVFLSPFSKKWIQFHPFNKEQYIEWELRWGEGHNPRYWGRSKEERRDLNSPRFGSPAYVVLNEPGALLQRGQGAGLKGMPENLFPPIVTATDGLKGLVIDHAPRWQKPRREAFMDWLQRGGELHILRGSDKEFPSFTAELSELNAPLPVQYVGQGVVYRHERTRQEMTAEFVKDSITNRGEKTPEGEEKIEVEYGAQVAQNTSLYWDFEDTTLQTLKAMTQPDHNWVLIYFMSFVYLMLIFPGGYLLGRRRIDYRIMIVALLGTISLFSAGFAFVGGRGYDETTTVNTVAIARPLGNGNFDVAAWSNAFVTDGDDYLIVHPGQGRLYSTCQIREGVAGYVNEDPAERFFAVDIPPYSSRPFAHRVKTKGPTLEYQLESLAGDKTLTSFAVTCGPELQKAFKEGFVLYGDRFYRLQMKVGRVNADSRGQKVGSMLNLDNQSYYGPNMMAYGYDWERNKEDFTLDERYQETLVPLLGRSMNFTDARHIRRFQLPTDRARLFLWAELPDEFRMQSDRFGEQAGRVLYCLDVLKQP